MPVALPPSEETKLAMDETSNEASHLSAYRTCLDFERRMLERENGKEENKAVIYARVLGYLILHAPSLTARHEIATVIQSCRMNEEDLHALGASFVQYFIIPFKRSRGRTPVSSDHSSRSSFDAEKNKLTEKITGPPKDHRDAKAQALLRDGFRCVVTGIYDAQMEEADFLSLGVDRKFKEALGRGMVYTKCVHIVPESTCFNVSTSLKNDCSTSVLAVLKCFGYDVERLKGPRVHSLYNVMTMEVNARDSFDRLEFYFEEIDKNCYRVKNFYNSRYFMRWVPERITFATTDPVNLPVPDPKLLALHAACAKVAHLSGAARYIDKFDQDVNNLDVLAHDGGSFDVLSHAILRALPRRGF